VGGGPSNTLSLLELLDLLRARHGGLPPVRFGGWRTGDQRHYVSDIRKLQAATGWRPRVGVAEGVGRLYDWLLAARAEDGAETDALAVRRAAFGASRAG
jgi:CDP-paratose 2-epimerase